MQEKERLLSGEIEGILELMKKCRQESQEAQQAVRQEDARLQDFLHAVEFAEGKEELFQAASQLQESRIRRRKGKDRVLELEFAVQYLNEPAHRTALNGLSQLLGNQRKREAYLSGDRKYYNRVTEDPEEPGKKEE